MASSVLRATVSLSMSAKRVIASLAKSDRRSGRRPSFAILVGTTVGQSTVTLTPVPVAKRHSADRAFQSDAGVVDHLRHGPLQQLRRLPGQLFHLLRFADIAGVGNRVCPQRRKIVGNSLRPVLPDVRANDG